MTKAVSIPRSLALVLCLVVGSCVLFAQRASAAPATDLVSASVTGLGGDGNSGDLVGDIDVSGDGRYVVFDSYADNLVPNDHNNNLDVFVRDRALGTTTLADVDNSGIQGSGFALLPRISANGRYVAFITDSALVPSDTNGAADVYVRDLQEDTTDLVSLAPGGQSLSEGVNTSDGVSISADGRYIAYTSYSSELSGHTDDSTLAVAVADRDSDGNGIFDEPGTITTTVAGYGNLGSMSPNGRYIGTSSLANGVYQTYLIDRDPSNDGTFGLPWSTTLVSATSDGTPADGNNGPGHVSDFGDVAFWSSAENIGGASGTPDVLVRAGDGSGITVVGQEISNQPQISADGRYVAFDSFSTNGVAADNNNAIDVFVTDRDTGVVSLESVGADGATLSFGGDNPALSADGNFVAFESFSTSLLPPGSPTSVSNVFLRDITQAGQGTSTPPGTGVTVTPQDAATGSTVDVTFGTVTTPGSTSVSTTADGPPPPAGFTLAGSATYYDISTSATYTGILTVCVPFDPSTPNPSALQLLHFDSTTSTWVDITTSVDTIDDVICGQTSSLSPFAVMQPAAADLSITNSAPPSVVSGSTLTYRIVVTNSGGSSATRTVVTDPLPASAHFVSASTSRGACSGPKSSKGGTVTCNVGDLGAGDSANLTIEVKATKPGPLSDIATATATNVKSDSDDSATATATVIGT
jgi:uncharacterized repeat protein (TIGR01451 family)